MRRSSKTKNDPQGQARKKRKGKTSLWNRTKLVAIVGSNSSQCQVSRGISTSAQGALPPLVMFRHFKSVKFVSVRLSQRIQDLEIAVADGGAKFRGFTRKDHRPLATVFLVR